MTTTSTTSNKQENLSVSKTKKKRQGRLVHSYEWFLELPVPLVLAAMWLAGVAFISVCGLVLYYFWVSLQAVAGS